MATTLETLSALERRLSLSVSIAEVGQQVERRLREMARTVRMPGFRPGKVPMKMIERSYGAQIQGEVLSDAVSKAFSDAVAEHQLRIAGQPRISPSEGAAEEGMASFSADFEVYPEVALRAADSLEVERVGCSVADADVDKTLDILRKQRTEWDPAGRAAADNDRVTIDFAGTLDGVAFQGGTATDFPFVLGEGRMLADFETGVRGASEGEQRTFPVAFPADYGSAELAGTVAAAAAD